MLKWNLHSVEEMELVGGHFATCTRPPLLLWLQGELGSGKTVFARGFIHALGWSGFVKSPTYTLVECYETSLGVIYHFDLYRLNDNEELEAIGVRDYFNDNAVSLIEWADRMRETLPAPDIVLDFAYTTEGRSMNADARSAAGQTVVEAVRRACQPHTGALAPASCMP